MSALFRVVVPWRSLQDRLIYSHWSIFWGYVKLLVEADKPETIDVLEKNIRCVIAHVQHPLKPNFHLH